MKTKPPSFTLSDIPAEERTPTVKLLLSVIGSLQHQLSKQSAQLDLQSELLAKQSHQLEALTNELKRLRKLKGKPKIEPSKLPKDPADKPPGSSSKDKKGKKRPGSKKRNKNNSLSVTHEETIKASNVPAGAVHKGYKDYFVQELEINTIVIRYRLERWQLPNGSYYTAELPASVKGHHFGAVLRAYILHQHHHQCVTQLLLFEQLKEWGVDISRGQLNRLLIEDKVDFHEEKSSILSTGLAISKHIQVDDTGARHKGVNGYCTHIGNELFAWFESTRRKSRVNFLKLLQNGVNTYFINEDSLYYMKRYKVPPWARKLLRSHQGKSFTEPQWQELLSALNITRDNLKRLVNEAGLIGSLFENGFSRELIILSDDAGQFNVFRHALCWIHAERGIKLLLPSSESQAQAIESVRDKIWVLYHKLLDYKTNPNDDDKAIIENDFDTLCTTKTKYHLLNLALKRLHLNKEELLMVLKHPCIPLHNNLSENDIREYVKRRKISGSTRSDEGRRCRDTFASLKKTARKVGVDFWAYLIDRLTFKQDIPQLSTLMRSMVTD